MIALALLIDALPQIDVGQPLIDRSFYVGGWYCTGAGCEGSRRRLGAALRFAGSAQDAIFNKAPHLAEAWNVTLDCAVSGSRLQRCKVQSDSIGSPAAKTMAVRIAQSTTLTPTRSSEPRAIVQVSYDVSGCAPWAGCVIEGPPPPPPGQPSGS